MGICFFSNTLTDEVPKVPKAHLPCRKKRIFHAFADPGLHVQLHVVLKLMFRRQVSPSSLNPQLPDTIPNLAQSASTKRVELPL